MLHLPKFSHFATQNLASQKERLVFQTPVFREGAVKLQDGLKATYEPFVNFLLATMGNWGSKGCNTWGFPLHWNLFCPQNTSIKLENDWRNLLLPFLDATWFLGSILILVYRNHHVANQTRKTFPWLPFLLEHSQYTRVKVDGTVTI